MKMKEENAQKGELEERLKEIVNEEAVPQKRRLEKGINNGQKRLRNKKSDLAPKEEELLPYKRIWIPAAAIIFTLGLMWGSDKYNKRKGEEDKEGYQAEKQALVSKIDSLEKEKKNDQYVDSLIERGFEIAKNEAELDRLVQLVKEKYPSKISRAEKMNQEVRIKWQNEKENTEYKRQISQLESDIADYRSKLEKSEEMRKMVTTTLQREKARDMNEDAEYKKQISQLEVEITDYRTKLEKSEEKLKSLGLALQKEKDNNSAEKKEYERKISDLKKEAVSVKKDDENNIVVYALDGLFLTDLKGTAPKNLTEKTSLHNIRNPRISPDKKKIIFNAGGSLAPDRNITVVNGIYSINTDGSDIKIIKEGAAFMPQWTPDGKYISYYVLPKNKEEGDVGALVAFNCESQKEGWLLKDVNIDEYEWSNNGKYIVYNFKNKSYLARIDRNLKIRFTNLLRSSLNPVFSSDDETIIHSLSGNLCYTDLFSVVESSSGTEEVRNCSPINLIRTKSEEIERMPRCSGNEVVFFQTDGITRRKITRGNSFLDYKIYVRTSDYPPKNMMSDLIELKSLSYLVADSDIKEIKSMIEDPKKTVTGNPLFCGDSVLFCINSQIYIVGKDREKPSLLLPEKYLPEFDTSIGKSNYDSVLKAKDYDAK